MHIHKSGHATLTRGGWIQHFAPLLIHYGADHPCWPLKRLLQPLFPICNQNALKAQFNVLSSVWIVLVKVPLYSDSQRVLCWTVHRVFQADRFVCMQNTYSHHLGSSWASELNIKVQTPSTSPRWANRSIEDYREKEVIVVNMSVDMKYWTSSQC